MPKNKYHYDLVIRAVRCLCDVPTDSQIYFNWKNGKKKGQTKKISVGDFSAVWNPPEAVSFCGIFEIDEKNKRIVNKKMILLQLCQFSLDDEEPDKEIASFQINMGEMFYVPRWELKTAHHVTKSYTVSLEYSVNFQVANGQSRSLAVGPVSFLRTASIDSGYYKEDVAITPVDFTEPTLATSNGTDSKDPVPSLATSDPFPRSASKERTPSLSSSSDVEVQQIKDFLAPKGSVGVVVAPASPSSSSYGRSPDPPSSKDATTTGKWRKETTLVVPKTNHYGVIHGKISTNSNPNSNGDLSSCSAESSNSQSNSPVPVTHRKTAPEVSSSNPYQKFSGILNPNLNPNPNSGANPNLNGFGSNSINIPVHSSERPSALSTSLLAHLIVNPLDSPSPSPVNSNQNIPHSSATRPAATPSATSRIRANATSNSTSSTSVVPSNSNSPLPGTAVASGIGTGAPMVVIVNSKSQSPSKPLNPYDVIPSAPALMTSDTPTPVVSVNHYHHFIPPANPLPPRTVS